MTLISIFWTIDGLTLLVAFCLFLNGLRSTKNTSYIVSWLIILDILGICSAGSYWLYSQGHVTVATLLAAIPAITLVVPALFLLLLSSVTLIERGRLIR
jgi:apolipoprotein N-acyltransferase